MLRKRNSHFLISNEFILNVGLAPKTSVPELLTFILNPIRKGEKREKFLEEYAKFIVPV